MSESNLTSKTANGAALLIGGRLCAKFIDLALLALLASLLTPADFGVVAIAMTLVLVVEAAMELSISSIIVRFGTVEPAHIDTAFTLGLMRAAAIVAVLCMGAWPLARFYGDPRLFGIVCALAAAPAARGMQSPTLALFARKIDFRRDVAIEVGGKLVASLVGFGVAWRLQSYWGIIAATIANPVAMVILSYGLAPYRPRLSLKKASDFTSFLRWSSAAQILAAINWQVDRLILAHFVPRADLGRYSLASDISSAPFQALAPPVMRPLMAALSSRRDRPEGVAEAYLTATRSLLTVGAPIMVGLAMLADPAVPLILGEKWRSATGMIQVLSLCSILTLIYAPLAPLAYSLDHGRAVLKRVGFELLLKLVLITLGALWWGIAAALAGRAAATLASVAVSMVFVREIVGLTVRRQLAALWRPAAGCAVLASAIVLVKGAAATHHYAPIAAAPIAGATVAFGIAAGGLAYVLVMEWSWRLSGRPHGIERIAHARIGGFVARVLAHRRNLREMSP